MPAIPLDTDVEEADVAPLAIPSVPDIAALPEPEPSPVTAAASRLRRIPQNEEERRRAIKRSKLELEAATDEVERQKSSLSKILTAVGLNIRESAAGATKQAVGNLTRTYADIVAPQTPHAPGSFKHLLQLSLIPTDIGGSLLRLQDQNDPESLANIARTAGIDLAAEGTEQMKSAKELTEQLGGGATVSGAASLASTAGASAPALLTAPLGLPIAATAAGLQAYGNNVDGFKEKLMQLNPKMTEQEAFDKAMLPAAVTGAVTGLLTRGFGGTERFIDNLVKQGVREVGAKAALREVFKSAALEFPEEYLDQLAQGFVEKGYIDPNKSTKEIFDDAALAGLSGFALGGLTTGAITGVAKAGSAATGAITKAVERKANEGKITTPGALPDVQGQPAVAGTEVKAPPGTAQRPGENQAVQPAPKVATFGGYQMGDIPSFQIPGIRPGLFRNVTAETARQLGYEVPTAPTRAEWEAAGRPMPTPQVSQQRAREIIEQPISASASPAPGTPQNPIEVQIQKADGTIETAEFTGYYDYRELGRGAIPSIGYRTPAGVSHGFLKAGDKIITPVPSFEVWSQSNAASPSDAVLLQKEAAPVNWREFSKTDKGYQVIDPAKLRDQLLTGKLKGEGAINQLLLHLLKDSSLHPLNPIQVINATPTEHTAPPGSSYAGKAYRGLFYTRPSTGNVGTIEVLLKNRDGTPVSQEIFVQVLTHELVHNNIGSKLADASPELQQEANDIFNFVLQNSTDWKGNRNALSNVNEFFSEALTDPEFQQFLSKLDYGATGKAKVRRSVFSVIADFIKRLLKLPDFLSIGGTKVPTVTVLEQAFSTASQLEQVQRKSANARSAAASPDNLSETQVQGGAAEVGRMADTIYKQREAAGSELEMLAFERAQYRTARREMRRLTDLATAGYVQMGFDPENVAFPDPESGVTIEDNQIVVDNTFTDALQVAGVQHTAANVQDMQAELAYEGMARRYNALVNEIASLQNAVQHYTALKVDAAEIEKINSTIANLEEKRIKLGSVEHNGNDVTTRALEMRAAEDARQQRTSRVAALSLDPVAEFFGRQVGGYRDFAAKLQASIDMAQQLVSETSDPAQLADAMEELQKWVNVPKDIQESIQSGRPLTKEQQASIFATLGQVFEDFDFARRRMQEMADSRIPELSTEIRGLMQKVTQAKIDKNLPEVVISDALATLNGESGATGNLKSMAETQALRERVSAIRSFAMALGNNLQTNRAVFDWLANPVGPKPQIAGALGVDPGTLDMILNEVKRNPEFGSAVLGLISASDKKIAAMPITGLDKMREALKAKTPEGDAQAEAIARDMIRQARAQSRSAGREQRDALRQIDRYEIERGSIDEGVKMFNELADSPTFRATRNQIANSPFGLVEQMVEQNHTATTFKPFGTGTTPAHAGLVLDASDDPNFKSEWFKKVADWHRVAQEHLDAFDVASALHSADPANNPPPTALGFDIPKIRGLRDAVARFVPGSFLELSLNSENKRWKVPWLVRSLSKLSLFRQHDFVSKMVGGITGTDLRARLADFVNHFLISQSVRDKYRDLPDRLHKALRSHPGLNMNIANYREHFNELAHWGRMFGSPVRAGFVLPRSGRTVTEEDMGLLQRERAYEEELRRRVTETNVTQGVRVKTPGRELVRPGAYVGDEGLPRFPGRRADSFIADVRTAYGDPAVGFDPTTNLGFGSSNLAVGFWNQNVPLLVQHILDARRNDRDMRLSPQMQQAELTLANNWLVNGVPFIQSVDELVNMLMSTYQAVPGTNVRDQVVNGLNQELRQYRDAAQRIATERAERAQARQSRPDIAFSAQNEFTRPAAKLELPSALYDYGALTPGDHLTMGSRANHERVVGYASAVERAIREMENRLERYRSGQLTEQQAAQSYGGNIEEMKEVIGILRQIDSDFKNAYASGSFANVPRGTINDTLGLLTSAILALPTVGLRNMTQGQFEVYAMSRAMGLAGHRLSAWRALRQMGKTITRFGLHAADGLVKRTNIGLGLLTGTNRHILESAIKNIGDLLTGTDFRASAQRISNLGLDNREAFLQRLARIWQETKEFVDLEDQQKAWSVGGQRVGKTAAIPFKVARALFDKIGVQQYDFAINSTALNYAELLKQRLSQLAIDYGQARAGLGQFDPNNPAWRLTPDEWSSFGTRAENEDSLGAFRLFLEGGPSAEGFQLERSLWNYYQQVQSGAANPTLMTDRQFDALTQKLLAEFNASTPANRPSSSAASPIVRNLLLLQGYPSDLLLKIFNSSLGGIRDRGKLANALVKTPAISMMALVAILIGYFTSAVTGSWEKYVRGRQPSLATPLDRDFWTNIKRWGEGTLALGAAQFGYLGDLILAMKGEVRGNRGFDPTGRILGISLITRALNAARGAYNTLKGAGSAGDALVPISDVGRSMIPFWLETENALGRAQGPIKQAERVLRGEAQTQGMLEGRSGFQLPTYGPTTVVRRNVGDAISRWSSAMQAGDTTAAETHMATAKAELQKLQDYHKQKYLAAGKDDATATALAARDTYNDYQDINPVVAAMLGKRPTQAQFDLLRAGTTGDRGQIVESGLKAWQDGSLALFGRGGAITREQVAAARGSGIGRGFNLPGVRQPSFPRIGAVSRRRIGMPTPSPVRAIRSRIRRMAAAPLERVRVRPGRRRALPKPPRFRSPRVGRSRLRRLAPRRQRSYAVA